MRSFKFPKMFKSNSSQIWREDEYNKATKQNVLLLLTLYIISHLAGNVKL